MTLTSSRALASRRKVSRASQKLEWKRSGSVAAHGQSWPWRPEGGGAQAEGGVQSHRGRSRAARGGAKGRVHTRGVAVASPRALPIRRGGDASFPGRLSATRRAVRVAVLPSADGRCRQGHRAVSLRTPGGRLRADARLRANGRVLRRAAVVSVSVMLCRAACR